MNIDEKTLTIWSITLKTKSGSRIIFSQQFGETESDCQYYLRLQTMESVHKRLIRQLLSSIISYHFRLSEKSEKCIQHEVHSYHVSHMVP